MSEDLTMTLYIALRTTPKHWRKGLASRTPTEGDAAAKALAEHLVKALKPYTITRDETPIILPKTH